LLEVLLVIDELVTKYNEKRTTAKNYFTAKRMKTQAQNLIFVAFLDYFSALQQGFRGTLGFRKT